ncbi:MAG TPA: hypothetical protein VF263_12590 [Longimicrobiaceae bacterium]
MAYRDFLDHAGVTWKVWDTYPHSASNVRQSYARGWLSFQSEDERRRLQPVPEGWEGATDDEMQEWLEASQAIRPQDPLPPRPERAPAGGEPAPADDSWHRTRAVVQSARRVIHLVDDAVRSRFRSGDDGSGKE